MCFVAEPMKRATFSEIVQIIEAELYDEEKKEYNELTEQYASMRELMEDPVTQLKRSSTFTCTSLKALNELQHPNDGKTVSPHKDHEVKKMESSYLKAVAVGEPELIEKLKQDIPSKVQFDCDMSNVENECKDIVEGCNNEYIAFSNNSDLTTPDIMHPDNSTSCYVAFADISTVTKNQEDHELLADNTIDNTKHAREYSPMNENICAAYVSIETANI